MQNYYVRVPFEGDNVVELIQPGDSGGHEEKKFGTAKAHQAITYYSRNDIEIDGQTKCVEMEVQGELERGQAPSPEQISMSVDVPRDRLEKLINWNVLVNGEKLSEDYAANIDVFNGKF